MNKTILAHVYQDEYQQWHEHALDEHLREVAKKSALFAQPFRSVEWAMLAGLWHDLGKYSNEFQQYIKQASGYDAQAHIEGDLNRVDHSTAGAIYAMGQLGVKGKLLAYLIAGHHAGLPDWSTSESAGKALEARLSTEQNYLLDRIDLSLIPTEILQPTKPAHLPSVGKPEYLHLWLRLLFSCLVDADFLDTENFMNPKQAAQRSGYATLDQLLPLFSTYMEEKQAKADKTEVNLIRARILKTCCDKASLPTGLFSLSVPTGGGKTLSSMAFALHHAVQHQKRRIIYVIPYTSIIEQTANIFREIFGDNVLEHHANLDPEQEDQRSRLACENWDAPIIVTTNVQFFESLFAARTSRCRKLHNIVNSVVVLDEAQLLVPDFLQPIVSVMNALQQQYGVSFVLSTATQPVLSSFVSADGKRFDGLEQVQELMDEPLKLAQQLKRVDVDVPSDLTTPVTWQDLAAQLCQHDSVLCIVNRRDDARQLHVVMPQGTIHLSALMCGEHRSQVIQQIKTRLLVGEAVRVISTQLVEAGVDLDFPVVYRALAGLDSIAQAAGRCNREGKLAGLGKVVVFVPPKPAPAGLLRQAEQISRSLLTGFKGEVLDRELSKNYFAHLYQRAANLDKHDIQDLLSRDARQCQIQFRSAADKFQLIEDTAYQTILVRFGESEALLKQLTCIGPNQQLMRKLQRYAVNVPHYIFEQLLKQGDVETVWQGIYAQVGNVLYDTELGLILDGKLGVDELII